MSARAPLGSGLAILLAAAAIAVPAGAADSNESQPIALHIVNYAHVPSWHLDAAHHQVIALLGAIGVRTVWRQTSGGDPAPAGKGLRLTLLLLSPEMERRKAAAERIDGNVLAVAAPEVGRAWAFYQRIERAAARTGHDVSVVLAHVLAHEIGHLVSAASGQSGHSEQGLMRGRLDLRTVPHEGFTEKQGAEIRAALRRVPVGSAARR
jgi:hypothetical protein